RAPPSSAFSVPHRTQAYGSFAVPIVLLSTSSGGSLSPRRYNSEPWSIVAAQEDRDYAIGLDMRTSAALDVHHWVRAATEKVHCYQEKTHQEKHDIIH